MLLIVILLIFLQTYKKWNGDAYDSEMLTVEYKAPLWVVDYLLHLNLDKNIKILDVCCGTGLVARYAKEKGYHNLHALDASAVNYGGCVSSDDDNRAFVPVKRVFSVNTYSRFFL